MKLTKTIFSLLLLVFFSATSFAQEKITKHTVAKGETITQIALKYKVAPSDIYKLNPDAQKGIKENDIILIQTSGSTPTTVNSAPARTGAIMHTAVAKETLYSIARSYNLAVADLIRANPALKDGLKVGQQIIIPKNVTETTVIKDVKTGAVVDHVVAQKETKFGIAKKYGITVAELERQNPGIVASLPVGYKLSISGKGVSGSPQPTNGKSNGTVTTTSPSDQLDVTKTTVRTGYANYEVKPKETMFSLTQMFNISEAELIALNPGLNDGLKIGMILKVPGKGSITVEQVRPFTDLSKSISGSDKKKMILLMPFNASKIQGDSLNSLSSRLKSDSFLNMTLDFYAGARMAIDSAKVLGLNIDVRILDSEESKISSNVADLVQNFNLKQADVVIGPFYQQYAEKTAELLSSSNVPVISPLSKDSGKAYSNLFQAMPSSDITKRAMFEYMISKGGNIIVVSDPKRVANREFIIQNYPMARFASIGENGSLNTEMMKSLFVADKVNYIVLDSEKTGMILSTTNALLNEMANYQLQLAILEPNETLDFEEISMKRLTILKLLYPSLTRENNSPQALSFAQQYRKINKVFPSQYAVRGFDITFDTMLRLSQGKPFAQSVEEHKTEQVESKFDYARKDTEGFINKGVYILQYNEDLSVTEAN